MANDEETLSATDKLKRRLIKSTVIPMIKGFDLAPMQEKICESVNKWPLQNGEQYYAGIIFVKDGKILVTKVAMSADNKILRQLETVTAIDGIELLLNAI